MKKTNTRPRLFAGTFPMDKACPKCSSPKITVRTLAEVKANHWGGIWLVRTADIVEEKPAYECRGCGNVWRSEGRKE